MRRARARKFTGASHQLPNGQPLEFIISMRIRPVQGRFAHECAVDPVSVACVLKDTCRDGPGKLRGLPQLLSFRVRARPERMRLETTGLSAGLVRAGRQSFFGDPDVSCVAPIFLLFDLAVDGRGFRTRPIHQHRVCRQRPASVAAVRSSSVSVPILARMAPMNRLRMM